MPAQKTILAVAIGDSSKSKLIKDSTAATLKGVRPYIKGLINWLNKQPDPPIPDNPLPKYKIGTDYIIDYRESDETQLQSTFTVSTDVIFCMSTTVARAAVTFTKANKIPTMPIVAVDSDPMNEHFPANVCAVSATRPQLAIRCYEEFKKKAPGLTTIYALHKYRYGPSDDSLNWLGKKITPVPVKPGDNIKDQIYGIPKGSGGLLILPADRFFGAADEIVQWAEVDWQLRTFWPVPDWPTGAFGCYGFAQELCGQYLAERVASIWSNSGNIPNPRFVVIDQKWITGKITGKRARRSSKARRRSR